MWHVVFVWRHAWSVEVIVDVEVVCGSRGVGGVDVVVVCVVGLRRAVGVVTARGAERGAWCDTCGRDGDGACSGKAGDPMPPRMVPPAAK